MSNFIESLISRHTDDHSYVKPRVRGLFEPVRNVTGLFAANPSFESEEASEKFEMPSVDYTKGIELENTRNRGYELVEDSSSGFAENNPILDKQETVLRPFVATTKPIFETESQRTLNNPKHESPNQPIIPTPQIQNLIIPNSEASNLLVREEDYANNRATVNEEKSVAMEGINPDQSQETVVVKPIIRSQQSIKPLINPPNLTVTESQNGPNGMPAFGKETAWLQDFKVASESFFNPSQAPVIKVTIGRIEVRAVTQTAPPIVKNTPAPKPRLTLEDYLKQQNSNSK